MNFLNQYMKIKWIIKDLNELNTSIRIRDWRILVNHFDHSKLVHEYWKYIFFSIPQILDLGLFINESTVPEAHLEICIMEFEINIEYS